MAEVCLSCFTCATLIGQNTAQGNNTHMIYLVWQSTESFEQNNSFWLMEKEILLLLSLLLCYYYESLISLPYTPHFQGDKRKWAMLNMSQQYNNASSVCMVHFVSLTLFVLRVFYWLRLPFCLTGTFAIYTVVSAFTVAFVSIWVPETKGKTLEEIQRSLRWGFFSFICTLLLLSYLPFFLLKQPISAISILKWSSDIMT